MVVKPLETSRLLLRPFREEDLIDLFSYACHPQVGPAAGWKPHYSISESRQILKSFMERDEVWAITLKDSGLLIGSIGLHKDTSRSVGTRHVRSLGYVLSAAYWGHGYATEAARRILRYVFSEMENPPEMISICHKDFNTRSRRVINKCGFKFEGVTRKAYEDPWFGVIDRWNYSMTEREWRQTVVSEESANNI